MQQIDLLIDDGYVLTFDDADWSVPRSIAVDKGKILEIGQKDDFRQKYLPKERLQADGKIVMPGFINAHTHVAMAYFRGLADDLPLMTWLNDHIWPAESKFLSPDFVYDSALHGMSEMIRNGITTFNDMYFFGDEIARAAQKIGIRAVIGETVLDFPVAGYQNPGEIIRKNIELHEQFRNNEMIDICIAPHAIYTCSKQTLISVRDAAARYGLKIHTHLSETQFEVENCVKETGMKPVEYLNSLGFFENRVIAAHGVWISEQEMDLLKDKETAIALNTKSNLKLSSGFAPVANYLKKGITLGLGTDGVASNNNLSMFEEMNQTSKLHKTLNNDPTFLRAEEMLKIATIGGARTLHKDDLIGSLEAGKAADLILLETRDINILPIYNAYSHLVYTYTSEQIKDVIINGKIVLRNRELITVDESELINKAVSYQQQIADLS